MKTSHAVTICLLIVICIIAGVLYANRAHAPGMFTSRPTILPLVEEHATTTYAVTDLSYPKSSLTEYKEIYNFVQDAKANFPFDAHATEEDKKNVLEWIDRTGGKYNMNLVTHIATSTKTVSYILELYEYTGGAHGMTSETSFTYDANGKLITIDKVFAKPYLARVAGLAREYFYNTLGDYAQKDMIDAGTEATTTNFSEWYLTDDAVNFIFQQYSVGPYVIGIKEFPLQKSQVTDLLAPEFR